MKLNVDYISYLYPLKDYLFFLNKKTSTFWKEIELKDEQIIPIMDTLCRHKAYDILIPLNMIVNIYMPTEIKEWWNTLIESIDSEKEVKDLTYLLYNKLSNDEERKFCDCMSDFEYFQYSNTYAIVENTVWEICNEYFPNMNTSKNGIYYCLYTGGLYSDHISYDYLKYIDEVVLQRLFDKEKKLTKEVLASPYELALIKRTIFIYCSEFGAFYYNIVGNMVMQIISCDTVRLEGVVDEYLVNTLKDTVNKQDRSSFYLTESFVDNLEQLYQYSEKYQFNSYSCKFLGASLPVLMQCVKKYNSAVDLSLNYINEMSLHEKADERILLALFIAMFTSGEDIQIHICNILDGIFNSEYQLNAMTCVIKDIIVFFEKFTQEMSMRFDVEKIAELKKYDPCFYCVYEICIPDLIKTGKTGIPFINDSFLLSKNIFNGTITNVMNKWLSVLDDTTTAYSEKLMVVSDFNHLFYSLASHLETEVRINITETCKIAELDNTNYISMLSDSREIFNIYNLTQIKELNALEKRLCEAYERIPKYNTVLKYEKSLSNYFKCKLVELRKEKFGTQAKNIYIIKN